MIAYAHNFVLSRPRTKEYVATRNKSYRMAELALLAGDPTPNESNRMQYQEPDQAEQNDVIEVTVVSVIII